MAGSFAVFDAVVQHLVARLAPARALDVGTGSGKYGRLLAQHAPACQRVGIEIEASHVQRFALDSLYQPLHVEDVTTWWRRTPDALFDLVLLGDCLQHLAKSDGIDLLNALVYRCGWLVLLVPEFLVQPALGGVASQAHRSVWSERDLLWHDLWAWDNCRGITLMVLRGYQPSPLMLPTWVDEVNAGQLPVRHFDGEAFVRPARLRLVQQPREVGYRLL